MSRSDVKSDHGWFRQLFESSPDPAWIIDGNRFVECNEAAIRALGYTSREEFLNVHPSKLSPPKQPDGQDSYDKAESMMAIAKDTGLHRFDWVHTKANGANFVAEVTLSIIDPVDRQVIYCVWRDITERKQMEDQVRQLAFYDPLTQLPNSRLLNDRLNQAMAASKRSLCYAALMFLDLDNFKPLNDMHGHVAGDLLLIEAADRLKSFVREMDTVARFGGDEFVLILSDLNIDEVKATSHAENVAGKIRNRLSEPYLLTIKREGKADVSVEHQCTVSTGVALFMNHEVSPDDILKWADTAMYQAKAEGRNSIRFYDSDA
ncbi:MAG: diguanylate cyclase domain-containing protein [Thiobacillaceae bacterium]